MNWEVWTMTSKTSCFNSGLMRRSLLKGAPLWGLWLLFWLLLLPVHLLTRQDLVPFELTRYLFDCLVVAGTFGVFFYGLAVAWLQFAWLYRTRSAYHYASLPIRRETQFVSRFLAGLLFHLVPALAVTLLTMAAGVVKGENVVLPALIFLACSTLMFLFYYGLAVFCAHLTGHVAAMPVLYLIANFLAPVLEYVLLLVADALIFGLSANQHLWPLWLSPLYYCLNRNVFSMEWLNRGGVTIGYVFTGWKPVLLFGAAGLVLAILAFLLFRRRRMESAGDVIAVSWLKPVFRYGVTLCCGLTLGMIIATLILNSSQIHFGTLLVCILFAAIVGFLAAEMLLEKTIRVFQKKNFLRLGGALVAMTLVLLACRYDVFGFTRYVPKADEVVSVSLDGRQPVANSTIIEKTIALHQEIVNHRHELENASDSGLHYRITYYLRDGGRVERYYRLPVGDHSDPDPSSLGYRMEVLKNDPTVLLENYFFTSDQIRLDSISVEYVSGEFGTYEQINMTPAQGENLLGAMRKDVSLGYLGKTGLLAEDGVAGNVSVYLQYTYQDGTWDRGETLYVTPEATHTLEVLKELGLPEEALQ